MASPIEQFEQLQINSEFLFLIYYRGYWCPFCQHWIKTLQEISPSIEAAGGKPVIVTAEENPEFLNIVKEKTNFHGTAILDPENSLATHLRSRGLVDVAITSKSGYSNGMAQPAVLVISKDGRVLYSWAIKPSMSNIGGAKDRPSLPQIWQDVDAQLQGRASVHSGVYKTQTFFQGISTKIFG